jgi:hypothetical protein
MFSLLHFRKNRRGYVGDKYSFKTGFLMRFLFMSVLHNTNFIHKIWCFCKIWHQFSTEPLREEAGG